jgi:hypothetical protein
MKMSWVSGLALFAIDFSTRERKASLPLTLTKLQSPYLLKFHMQWLKKQKSVKKMRNSKIGKRYETGHVLDVNRC